MVLLNRSGVFGIALGGYWRFFGHPLRTLTEVRSQKIRFRQRKKQFFACASFSAHFSVSSKVPSEHFRWFLGGSEDYLGALKTLIPYSTSVKNHVFTAAYFHVTSWWCCRTGLACLEALWEG